MSESWNLWKLRKRKTFWGNTKRVGMKMKKIFSTTLNLFAWPFLYIFFPLLFWTHFKITWVIFYLFELFLEHLYSSAKSLIRPKEKFHKRIFADWRQHTLAFPKKEKETKIRLMKEMVKSESAKKPIILRHFRKGKAELQ